MYLVWKSYGTDLYLPVKNELFLQKQCDLSLCWHRARSIIDQEPFTCYFESDKWKKADDNTALNMTRYFHNAIWMPILANNLGRKWFDIVKVHSREKNRKMRYFLVCFDRKGFVLPKNTIKLIRKFM